MMTLEEAKQRLNNCTRHELRDHAFGDREIGWYSNAGMHVAEAYISRDESNVYIGEDATFTGADALALATCGKQGTIERNDTTGPDEYQDGVTMPGLTLEGVKKELTGN